MSIGTLDAGAAALELTETFTTSPAAALPGEPDIWVIPVVNMDGTIYQYLRTAEVIAVRWAHMAPTEADIECDIDDPGLVELDNTDSPPRELQVYLNGHLLAWGKPVVRRAASGSRRMAFTIKDPMWYLQRRHIGNAVLPNFLLNGRFDGSPTTGHWTKVGGSLTFTAPTNNPLDGTHSAKLVETTTGADHYISQRFTAHAGSIGLAVYLTAWFYLDTFSGTAAGSRGLYLARVGAHGAGALGVTSIAPDTPRQRWTKQTVVVNMPPNTTETLEARLYAPHGTIYWDAVIATVDDSLTFNDEDIATIVQRIATYAQGTGPFGYLAPEKSDCRIRVNAPLTGVRRTRVYHFDVHQVIYDGGGGLGVLDEFLKSADGLGLEFRMEYTTTTRTLHTYYPAAGVTWGTPFIWRYYQDEPAQNSSWGITGWDYGQTLEQAANQIVELNGWGGSSGTEVTRDEAGYSNPATLGGLTLELVETAPDSTPVGGLEALAEARGALLENGAETPTITIEEPRDPTTGEVITLLIGVLLPGDVIPVDVVDGAVVMQGLYRVAALVLDGKTLKMTATVNPV